ncbi:MAG: cytochrome P450 [Myxococcota bacterium]|nr:cytochrome P450 [Myxococcota bacterium]
MVQPIDLSDPESFERGFPHEHFRALRREAPVAWHEGETVAPDYPAEPGPGYWVVSKYEDIKYVSKNPGLFASTPSIVIVDPPQAEAQLAPPSMIGMDPPDHARYRKLVSGGFTPSAIAAQEPRHRAIVDAILDPVAQKGECDFVTEIAAELPLRVICEFLGVPEEDRHQVFEWSNRMLGGEDPEYKLPMDEGIRVALEMFVYANGLAEKRRDAPSDDLISAMIHGKVDGEQLSIPEFDSFFLLLAVAGNETTRNLISHGMLQLIEHPEAYDRLVRQPELIPSAVEEMLRYRPPVMYFRRTATRDTEIRGQKIRKGEKVTLWYPSANRDEDVFPDPDRFDIERSPNDHMAFGMGQHFCLGSHLARLEIRIMFEQLLRRLPDIELTGPVDYLRSHFIDGVKHMPVRFTPERV